MTKLPVALLACIVLAGCSSGDDPEGPSGGPTFVENHPGDLAITTPARGAFIAANTAGRITVTGTGATKALTIDGEHVTPASDGSFTTTVAATEGIDLIRAVDGERSIDTPVLYGELVPASKAVPAAVALRINALGLDSDDDSVVSLGLLARKALDDVDLLAALKGQKLTGNIPGGSWTFTVKSTHYGKTGLHLSPRAGGAKFTASVANVKVDGTLSVKVFGVGPSGGVSLTADAANVGGGVDVKYDGKAALEASASGVTASLKNFQYDSNDAGFPCCVDDIMTGILRPKVQKATQEKVEEALSKSVALALSKFHLPERVDLAGAGFPATIEVSEKFDGAKFDAEGGRVTAAVHFHHEIAETNLGARAPGWLSVSKAPGEMDTKSSFGISIALDALNQALFAAWAQNGLERTVGDVPLAGTVQMRPMLPPIVLPGEDGGLTAFAGEIVVTAELNGVPVKAAITIIDDLAIGLGPDAGSLLLTPQTDEAVISVTWLEAEGLADSLREVIEGQIVTALPSLLTPVTLPLPTLPLGEIAPSFGTAVGALSQAKVVVDAGTRRVALHGDLAVIPH